MSSNSEYQDSGLFREWTSLNTLMQKIPTQIQIGLFTQNIYFTCIDAVTEFIAVGTNHGIVYWFNRLTEELETLRCENVRSVITCVQIVSTVDYMVAAGNNQGVVTIFQIPKQLPDSLPEILRPKRKKQVERFSISGLHKSSVTAIEWSKNGMKLFSGDQNGLIVLTEMDYYLHLSKSNELLNEKYSVVQLSHQNGLLLISTLFRTIIVDRNQNNQVTQVGQKERKMLGKFGAVFGKNKNYTQVPVIYACRPGLRIWQADTNGTVLKTLILKDAVNVRQPEEELLNSMSDSLRRKCQSDKSFGVILPLSDNFLITHNENVIYIINPNATVIASVIIDLRKIKNIACSEDEIFILEDDRSIVRIASYPETTNSQEATNNSINDSMPIAESTKSLVWGISELTSKLKSNAIIPAISKIKPVNLLQSSSFLSPVTIGIDAASIANAEEAIEVPPITPLTVDTQLLIGTDALIEQASNYTNDKKKLVDRKDIFKKIGEQEFEEVVFTPKRKGKKLIKNSHSSALETHNAIPGDNGNHTLLNSDMNLETIQEAVQHKEKLLSDYLNFDLSIYMDKSPGCIEKSESSPIDSNDINNLFQSCTIDAQDIKESINNVTQESEEHRNTDQIIVTDTAGNSKQNLHCEQVNQNSRHNKTDSDISKVSEFNFNAMSKEFVKSTLCQDSDDWILIG